MLKTLTFTRKNDLKITADMYTYNASSTGLTGVIPTWVQEGGHRAWINRMKEPKQRKIKPKNYASNFDTNRKEPWTH